MTHPILSRIPILRAFVDERFLEHRRRASSLAGIICACLAICLWCYRFVFNHVWSWDLLFIALTFVVIKMSMFVWYRIND
jgi:hypothetical protein